MNYQLIKLKNRAEMENNQVNILLFNEIELYSKKR